VLDDPIPAHPAKRIVPAKVATKTTMFEVRDVVFMMTSPKSPLSPFRYRLATILFVTRGND
jgi:hypothetical protein